MSRYYAEHGERYIVDYDGFRESDDKEVIKREIRTKQSFKDQCDINKMLAKAQVAGSLSHLERHGAFYGDFSDVDDLLTAHERLKRGQAMFDELPSEVRKDFGNDQFKFWEFVNDPANKDDLEQLLPKIAKPGTYFKDQSPSTPPGALSGAPSGVEPAPVPTPPSIVTGKQTPRT